MSKPNVQENITLLDEVLQAVKNHCMCLYFREDAGHYLVQFPHGYQVDGCRVSKSMGKIAALNKMIEKMEQYWRIF